MSPYKNNEIGEGLDNQMYIKVKLDPMQYYIDEKEGKLVIYNYIF